MHFVLEGKTRVISNWSDLFQSHMLRSCQFPVRVPYFGQVSTTFVVTQLQISKEEENMREYQNGCVSVRKPLLIIRHHALP